MHIFYFNSLGDKGAPKLSLIAEQFAEVQEAVSKLTAQVQKIQESLQAVSSMKKQNRNNYSSISELAETI